MIGRTSNGTGQKVVNTLLKNLIGFKADDVFVIICLQKFIKVWQGKGCVSSKVATYVPLTVTSNDGFQNFTPTVGTMNITGTQGAPLQIAKLIKQE